MIASENVFIFLSILQMLGIVTHALVRQESITAIWWILSTKNDWFKVDSRFFRKNNDILSDFNVKKYTIYIVLIIRVGLYNNT